MSHSLTESELIINTDGSIYHLNITPDDIATDIITVGDPDRVDHVADRLDEIYLTKQKREFKTITGRIGHKEVTIISTGIGTDNIDIVLTELDALTNVDFNTRKIKENHTSLNIYRIGTSGGLREDISIGSIVISQFAIGLEGLMHFYDYESDNDCKVISEKVRKAISDKLPSVFPYTASYSPNLGSIYKSLGRTGITVTATGFYGPQGRKVIANPRHRSFLDDISAISLGDIPVTNLEMETAGIYGMAHLLGHQAISFNAILANRVTQRFSSTPHKIVDKLIDDFFVVFSDK